MSRKVTLDELSIIASNCRESIWAEAQSQGREPKIYLHWTAGGYYSIFNDYHINITGDGSIYITTEDLAVVKNHTWRRNTGSVGGMKGLISGEVDLGDGLFEVTLVRMPKNPIELSQIVSSLTGVDTETDMVTSFQTNRVKFTAAEEIPWTLDGEYGGKPTEVEIRALHGAVRIVS